MKGPASVPNTLQRKLAEEVTRFVHGEEGLAEAIRATRALAPGGTTKLDAESIEAVAADLPSFSALYADVVGSPLVDVCVLSGLFGSKGAARRFIKQGGLYLNNAKVEDEAKIVESGDVIDERILLLSAGKKNKIVVRLER
jgi:tyrosyl-tRNA synthetase